MSASHSKLLPIVERPGLSLSVRQFVARAALVVLIVVASVLALRRAGGAFTHPLSISALALLTIVATILTATTRATLPLTLAGRVLPTWLFATVALALSLRETSPLGLVLLWSCVVGEAVWHWRSSEPMAIPTAPQIDRPRAMDQLVRESVDEIDESSAEEELDVRQSLRRGVTSDGIDVLTGEVHAVFVAEQRIEHVHLSFCPPFERTPTFDLEQIEGPEARIEVAQLLPYGVRLELKLSQSGPARVTIAFSARLTPET
jgi:hypothetical protein